LNLRPILEADARWTERLRVAEKPGPLHVLGAFLAHSGDSWFWGLALVVIWAIGGGAWKAWSLRLLIAIAATAGVVFALKLTFRRRRPEGDWGSIYRTTDPHSFPSGHAARGVLLAMLVAVMGPTWLAPILIVWAPLVAVARVAMGLHYLSDIVAGAVIGCLAAVAAILIFPYVMPLP
jgi:membrane-associated phospholipid phosphatase